MPLFLHLSVNHIESVNLYSTTYLKWPSVSYFPFLNFCAFAYKKRLMVECHSGKLMKTGGHKAVVGMIFTAFLKVYVCVCVPCFKKGKENLLKCP